MEKERGYIEGYAEVMERLGGSEALLDRLLIKFRDSYGNSRADFDSCLSTGKLDDAYRIVHSIKGVSANLGLGEVWRTAIILEARLREGEYTLIDGEREAFFLALEKAASAI